MKPRSSASFLVSGCSTADPPPPVVIRRCLLLTPSVDVAPPTDNLVLRCCIGEGLQAGLAPFWVREKSRLLPGCTASGPGVDVWADGCSKRALNWAWRKGPKCTPYFFHFPFLVYLSLGT
ncbi:uncharacterized protein LOC125202214 [Salvia hispanica]|uniref:uncharacterized protein LOC125192072 n=1 Tax=Salvia hispanica TaxID=49212 RepID=UPI002008FD7B|nr:uncharacterized protein LOC125192072 [Salvia hispanica]XP_047956537.1 uncharacterized protein LOC125202214 [Salvia hispanica]